MGESNGIWSAIHANRRRIRLMRQALTDSTPDRIISLTDRTNVLTLLAARKINTPVIVSERTDIRHHRIGRIWEWLRNRTYPTACSIVVQTEAVKSAVLPMAGSTRVSVIPNAIASTVDCATSPDLEFPADRKWFVAVGRLSFEKGFDRLIDAFARISSVCNDWNLLIVGDGPERSRLLEAIHGHELDDRALLPGWIESPWKIIPFPSVAVLPSRYEGFPNVLLEAMSRGVAPIAFDCESGPSEIIRPNIDGLLVPEGDVVGLADAMQSLATDDSLRRKLGKSAISVNDRFSSERIYSLWETVLNCSE